MGVTSISVIISARLSEMKFIDQSFSVSAIVKIPENFFKTDILFDV